MIGPNAFIESKEELLLFTKNSGIKLIPHNFERDTLYLIKGIQEFPTEDNSKIGYQLDKY